MDFEKASATPHALGLSSVENDRELGGYQTTDGRTIKAGKLLRTAHLHALSDEDMDVLQNTYHVGTVIDFRSHPEVDAKPDIMIPGTHYVHINLFPEEFNANEDGVQVMHADDEFEMAYQMITKPFELSTFYLSIMGRTEGKEGYRRFFDELLKTDEDKAILFHCTAGKDRTGMAAAYLMAVLGVDRKTITEDYMLTNEFCQEKIEFMVQKLKERDDDPMLEVYMRSMMGVRPEIINSLFDFCEKYYGSIANYVKTYIGVTDEEIAQLKEKFLD